MLFRQLFDAATSTYTYLLADEETREAVLIDPVLEQVDRDLELVRELRLELRHVLETHVHADHVTGAGELRQRTGARTVVAHGAGAECADVQVRHGDVVRFGKHALEVRATPGHTDGCLTYVTADRKMAFTGDALLIRGCGRTDFQQGDSRRLYRSVREQIFTLPDEAIIYPGHDYKGRMLSMVGEEKALNPRLGAHRTEDEFVQIMSELKLAYPKRIAEALPMNLRCGRAVQAAEPVEDAPAPGEWAPVVRSATGVPEVTPAWVAGQRAGGVFRVVDVREPAELLSDLGAIEGVVNVPLADVAAAARGWEREAPLVLVCRSGGRSGRAALELERLGFGRVASMAGGMLRWREERLPVAP
jgi:sulfur dioxygenase